MKINLSNWNYAQFSTGSFQAMISCGIDPNDYLALEENSEMAMCYWVSILKDEFQEIFQRKFTHLAEALSFINERYGHWNFVDTSVAKGGCESCSNKS